MKIIVKHDIDKAVKAINNFDKRHLPEATAKSINITLFGLRKEMMKQLPKKTRQTYTCNNKRYPCSKSTQK